MKNRFDIHIHSNFSDGVPTVRQIIKKAMKMGLKGIMIADHDTVEQYKFAKKILPELKKEHKREDFILIPGVEITTPQGDILAIGVEQMFHGSIKEIIDKIHQAGGVASAVHPYGGYWPISFAEHFDDFKDCFDAIEILNSGVSPQGNKPAIKLAEKYKLAVTGGSDAHLLNMVGTSFTLSDAETVDEFINSIKNKKTTAGTILKEFKVLL